MQWTVLWIGAFPPAPKHVKDPSHGTKIEDDLLGTSSGSSHDEGAFSTTQHLHGHTKKLNIVLNLGTGRANCPLASVRLSPSNLTNDGSRH